VAELIAWANASGAPVLSLDLPSGFDAQEGRVRNPAIRADATLSLGLPKRGLLSQSFAHVAGAMYVADISVPREAWARMSVPMTVPSFGGEEMLRLLRSGEHASDMAGSPADGGGRRITDAHHDVAGFRTDRGAGLGRA
jgi:YjeF-related protein N-terminus